MDGLDQDASRSSVPAVTFPIPVCRTLSGMLTKAAVVAVAAHTPPARRHATITALAVDGAFAIAYLPTNSALTIDLSKVSGKTVNAWWFNPRTGAATTGGQFTEKKSRAFDPPEDGDWVLVLDDAGKNFLPP